MVTGGGWVKKYLRVDEVAAIFHVHPRTVRRWIIEERTPIKTLPNSRPLRIIAASVIEFERDGFR